MTTERERDGAGRRAQEGPKAPDWSQLMSQAAEGTLPETPALEALLDRWQGARR